MLQIFLEFIDRAETSVIYFCARVINHSETPINNKFGIQTPSIGGIKLLKAKVTENLESIIYDAPRDTPTARLSPIPPLTFREATDTPMSIRINKVAESAVLL